MLTLKNKQKKSKKMRAQTTHGWGAKKKHRGSGNRGGVGMAGTGKRADQKKPSILKKYGHSYYGKKGFTSIHLKQKAINLFYIDTHAEQLTKNKENNIYIVDITKLGYHKLLGSGIVTKKLKIICDAASKNAIAKVSALGGEVIVKNKKTSGEPSNA